MGEVLKIFKLEGLLSYDGYHIDREREQEFWGKEWFLYQLYENVIKLPI